VVAGGCVGGRSSLRWKEEGFSSGCRYVHKKFEIRLVGLCGWGMYTAAKSKEEWVRALSHLDSHLPIEKLPDSDKHDLMNRNLEIRIERYHLSWTKKIALKPPRQTAFYSPRISEHISGFRPP